MSCGCEIGKKFDPFKTNTSLLQEKILKSGLSFDKLINLFTPIAQDVMSEDYYPYPKLLLNREVLDEILSGAVQHMSLQIPDKNGSVLKINLCEYNIYKENVVGEKYFHGIIENVNSLVTFSFFKDVVYGTVNYEDDNFDIFQNGENYSVKRTVDNTFKTFNCEVERKTKYDNLRVDERENIGIWLEARSEKISAEYLKNLFSIIKTVYENEGIALYLSGLKMWGDGNPFSETEDEVYQSFKKYRNENVWTGDLAVLIDVSNSDTLKNISGFNTLYEKSESYSYCQIVDNNSTLNSSILSHSIGHNFGVEHVEGNCNSLLQIADIMTFCHNGQFPLLMQGFSSDSGDVLRQKLLFQEILEIKAEVKVPTQEIKLEIQEIKPEIKLEIQEIKTQEIKTQGIKTQEIKLQTPEIKPERFRLPEIPPLLNVVKMKKCGKRVKKYVKVVGNGDVIRIKTDKKRTQLTWESLDLVKSSHQSGTYFPLGDTRVTVVISSWQGTPQTLSFTIRVVPK